MITGNRIIFGLGTVGAVITLDSMIYIRELRLGRYKIGEKTFREDNDIKNEICAQFDYKSASAAYDEIEKLKESENKVVTIKGYDFDFTRDVDNKSINVVLGWFRVIIINCLRVMAC